MNYVLLFIYTYYVYIYIYEKKLVKVDTNATGLSFIYQKLSRLIVLIVNGFVHEHNCGMVIDHEVPGKY